MPKVDISPYHKAGLIISYPTNIFYGNITEGVALGYHKCEGIFIPLGDMFNYYDYENKKLEHLHHDIKKHFWEVHGCGGARTGISQKDVDIINTIFTKYKLGSILEVDQSKLSLSREAWLHVLLNVPEKHASFSGFEPYPREAILTWENCD